jgi:hypothetical protein
MVCHRVRKRRIEVRPGRKRRGEEDRKAQLFGNSGARRSL